MSYKKIIISLIITGIFFFSVSLYFFQQNYQKQQKKPTTQNTETTQPSTPPNNHYLFKSKGGHFDTYFPQNVLDINSDIKVEKDESSISFSLLSSSNKTITGQMINKTQVLYPKISQTGDAFIDLKYTVSNDQINEEFILNQKQTFPIFKQKINLFNAFVANYSQSIQFNHPGTNQLLWYIPTPFMYEQNHPEIKHQGIKLKLECDSPNTPLKDCRVFNLIKEITSEGQQWLDDPNRNYPVIIDPTVADSCWGLDGLCDNGCIYGAITGSTVYTGCNNGTLCTGTNCWYTTAGTCNTGCTTLTVSPVTAYTTCSASTCYTWSGVSSGCETTCRQSSINYYPCYGSSTNCENGWQPRYCYFAGTSDPPCNIDGTGSCICYVNSELRPWHGTQPTCVNITNLGPGYRTPANCTKTATNRSIVSNSGTWYTGSGSCNTSGSGNCYALTGGTTTYTGSGGCPSTSCVGSATRYQSTPCTWATAKYPKVVSGSTTRYTGSGFCQPNSGSCYKLTLDTTDTYTANDNNCGASTCAGGSKRYSSQTCIWYGESGGDSLRFEGIRLERLKIN